MTEITQADRDADRAIMEVISDNMRGYGGDTLPIITAHRELGQREGYAQGLSEGAKLERDRIVAWLRDRALQTPSWDYLEAEALTVAANAIERNRARRSQGKQRCPTVK